MALWYPMATGLKKGHKVTKDCLAKHTKFMWHMTREMCSFMPYEVGTHIHAKRKRELLSSILSAMKKAAAKKN
ncbi:unnamed protein product [Nyctereutes procyonoides]|uniref:(raccoon dog) hypothetical protein n=1 Tax=Nyctereutes procyonoides TaxID=34880 RepID=A0A811Y5H1_NYCPR|nr:unnamed protein product [Nyctereutes procyonoides]